MAVASLTSLACLFSPPPSPLIQLTPSFPRLSTIILNSKLSFPLRKQEDALVLGGVNTTTTRRRVNVVSGVSNLNTGGPLISPQDHWGLWTALFATATFGLWSERTKIGGMISAALVTILLGIAASNLGLIPYEAPAYSIVFQYLLPLTIPLLLFRADMLNVIHSTGTLFFAFLLGSVATVIGTLVAFLLVPMRSLGQDAWKIAACLMGSYIGGAVNYVAVGEALGVSPSVLAAGVAADNVICAIYFVILFMLASKIPAEPPSSNDGAATQWNSGRNLPVLQTAAAIAISMAICKAAVCMCKLLGIQGGILPVVTTLVVILATLLPRHFAYIAPAGEAIAVVLMQTNGILVHLNFKISQINCTKIPQRLCSTKEGSKYILRKPSPGCSNLPLNILFGILV